jgi:hypothetical protein
LKKTEVINIKKPEMLIIIEEVFGLSTKTVNKNIR